MCNKCYTIFTGDTLIRLNIDNPISLPDVFLNRYRSADSAALKVALYLFEYKTAEEKEICEALNLSENIVKRSLDYWQSAGLFSESTSVKPIPTKPIEPVKRHLNHSDIASAVLNDKSISMILQETQNLLGRELSFSESRLLVETMQDTEFDPQCILLLEEYYLNTEHSKHVLTDACRTARNLSKESVRSYSSVERYILLMETRYDNLLKVSDLMKTEVSDFSKKDKGLINRIFEEFGYDCTFISEVLIRKPDANLPYIFSVLKDWNKKGYRTISDTRLLSPASDVIQINNKIIDNNEGSTLKKAVKRNRKDQ